MSRIKVDCSKWDDQDAWEDWNDQDDKDDKDIKSSVLENPQLHLVSQH